MKNTVKGYIDIHTHWLMFGKNTSALVAQLEWLEAYGFNAVAIFPLPGMGTSPEKMVDLIPEFLHEPMGLNLESAAHDDLKSWWTFQRLWMEKPRALQLLSFLDVRAWNGQTDLGPWWGNGHTGLKGILIEEEDHAKMAMPPLQRVNGLSRTGYREAQRAVFTAANRYNVPLVYHADLKLHTGFVEECLQEYPRLRVNIPHCGLSRKAMGKLLHRYPSLVTDISSLGPYIAADPESYRAFILKYPGRVLLGSDMLASIDLRQATKYVDYVHRMDLPKEVENEVLSRNARLFLANTSQPKVI